MSKYKVCVYAICLNEEKFVDRWYESMKEADEIYVLDTDSTDNTVVKLKEKGIHVEIKKIEPWRFDVARNRDWTWWHRSNNVGYPLKNCVKSFHPIYRCSRAALCYLDEYQKKGFSAHSEVMMSTALYNAGFVVEDFGGDGDFVRQGNINRFYCCDGTVNGGTLRYRPLYSMEELECEALSDMLYHPLKI